MQTTIPQTSWPAGALDNDRGRPQFAQTLARLRAHPIPAALLVFAIYIVISTGFGLTAKVLLPQFQPEFVALCALAVVMAALLTMLGLWRAAGFNGPARWRDAKLIGLPLLIFGVLPLLAGLKPSDSSTLIYLIVAYALTGFMEEALTRGLMMWLLQPLGQRRAIVISSILFGAMHIGNLLYRNPAIVFAQMIGAFCDGVGQGAIRARTHTIWFVILIHALHDLMLRYSNLPTIPLDVVQDTLMLFYGLYLMRSLRAAQPGTAQPEPAAALM